MGSTATTADINVRAQNLAEGYQTSIYRRTDRMFSAISVESSPSPCHLGMSDGQTTTRRGLPQGLHIRRPPHLLISFGWGRVRSERTSRSWPQNSKSGAVSPDNV